MTKKKLVIFLAILTVCFSVSLISVQAAFAKQIKSAKKAYAAFWAKHPAVDLGESYYDAGYSKEDKSYINSFALYDLNGDDIPYKFSDGTKVEFDLIGSIYVKKVMYTMTGVGVLERIAKPIP